MAGKKQTPRSMTALQLAITNMEASERPFYEGMKHLKQAAKDLAPILANIGKYRTAMRLANTIAEADCESGNAQPKHKNCAEAIKAGDMVSGNECWPCYARNVLKRWNA